MEITIPVIVFALYAVSLIGIFIPFLPGLVLAWVGFIIYVITNHHIEGNLLWIILLTLITIVAILSDTIFSLIGAKAYNSSRYGIIGGFLGFIVGIFIFPPFGMLIGPFAGIYIGEIASGKDPKSATRALWGAVIGFIVSVGLKVLVWIILLASLLYLIFI